MSRSRPRRGLRRIRVVALVVGLLTATWATAVDDVRVSPLAPTGRGAAARAEGPAPGPGSVLAADGIRFGAFLGSGPEGVRRLARLGEWLGGRQPRVGHTYLPGDLWVNIEGKPAFLRPWAKWRQAGENRLFVLNVPMLERNEADVPDREVDRLLRAGAAGRFDHHFRTLARRLVRLGLSDTVLVLGWEMNGTTYTHRCAPNPEAWKTYWRRIVATMRSVPGAGFRFDYAPSRGRDAIPWTRCYPGDDVVDIIGMDSYDQPPGETFEDQVNQPFGLGKHVAFAAAHDKPISYPEWGLFRDGDNPSYVRDMIAWIREHDPVYHTLTDYCPHGVWQCESNPRSTAVFRFLMSTPPPSSDPRPHPGDGGWPGPEPFCFCVELADWLQELLGREPLCFSYGDRG